MWLLGGRVLLELLESPEQQQQQQHFTPASHQLAKMQAAFSRTCVSSRAGVFGGSISSRVAPVAPQRAQLAPTLSRRGAVQVVAAEGEGQKKKRTPQPEKRAQLSKDRRSRNRSRKSAIATRTKKVSRGRSVSLQQLESS